MMQEAVAWAKGAGSGDLREESSPLEEPLPVLVTEAPAQSTDPTYIEAGDESPQSDGAEKGSLEAYFPELEALLDRPVSENGTDDESSQPPLPRELDEAPDLFSMQWIQTHCSEAQVPPPKCDCRQCRNVAQIHRAELDRLDERCIRFGICYAFSQRK